MLCLIRGILRPFKLFAREIEKISTILFIRHEVFSDLFIGNIEAYVKRIVMGLHS
jgi:hypothetical protein